MFDHVQSTSWDCPIDHSILTSDDAFCRLADVVCLRPHKEGALLRQDLGVRSRSFVSSCPAVPSDMRGKPGRLADLVSRSYILFLVDGRGLSSQESVPPDLGSREDRYLSPCDAAHDFGQDGRYRPGAVGNELARGQRKETRRWHRTWERMPLRAG